MDKKEFTRLQYVSLREEIRETKARIFKTLGFGLVVMPAANFVAVTYEVDVLIVLMPLLIIAVALIYLSENRAKMRCGRYIRLHVERDITGMGPGWETWLENPNRYDTGFYDARCVDKYIDYCFYILFVIYFGSSVFLAARFIRTNCGMTWQALLLGVYVPIGIVFMWFLFQNSQVCTSIKGEQEPGVGRAENLRIAAG